MPTSTSCCFADTAAAADAAADAADADTAAAAAVVALQALKVINLDTEVTIMLTTCREKVATMAW